MFIRRRNLAAVRRGTVLVLLAPLMFVLFALAAMVLDLGLARATQRQMQSKTDNTALENLRTGGNPNPSQSTAVPLYFGKASLLSANAPIRQNGVTVRASSVAGPAPAMAVGVPNATYNLPGTAPFALSLADWQALPLNSPTKISTLQSVSGLFGPSGPAPQTVGMALPSPDPSYTLDPATTPFYQFMPIYAPFPSGNYLIGFGCVQIAGGAKPTVTKLPATLAAQNATAVVAPAFPSLPGNDGAAVLSAFTTFGSTASNQSLTAPTLTGP